MDYAHEQIDKRIEEISGKLKKEYSIALNEIQQKATEYFAQFEKKDAIKRDKVKKGEITFKEYKEWRVNQIMYGQRYLDMIDKLSNDLTDANVKAMKIISESLTDTFIEAANYTAYEIEQMEIQANFVLYNEDAINYIIKEYPDLLPKGVDIPKDLLWNKQKLNSAILQGILQGDSIPHLADRLQLVTDMDRRAAIRNARTMHTAAESKGRQDSYKRAESMGIEIQQQWLATIDNRTRDAHRELDGDIQPLGKPFENSIGKIRYPGDPDAHPSNVYNCRCAIRGVIKGHSYKTDRFNQSGYEEWKKGKKAYKEYLEGQ